MLKLWVFINTKLHNVRWWKTIEQYFCAGEIEELKNRRRSIFLLLYLVSFSNPWFFQIPNNLNPKWLFYPQWRFLISWTIFSCHKFAGCESNTWSCGTSTAFFTQWKIPAFLLFQAHLPDWDQKKFCKGWNGTYCSVYWSQIKPDMLMHYIYVFLY